MEFKTFLAKAKVNGYASSGEGVENNLEDGSKELIFEEGDFRYVDRYFGHDPFIGEEIVWKQGKLYWGMNYYGSVLSQKTTPKKVYDFLKKALKKPNPTNPVRGPVAFSDQDLRYVNIFEGSIDSFHGKELIFLNREVVYSLVYNGGLIKTK